MCPYCGTTNPIDDSYQTKDVTSFIGATKTDGKLYKSKSKKIVGLLCLLLGYFGAHNFYLGFKKKAIIELLVSILVIGGIGAALFFLLEPLKNALAFLIPFGILWLVYIFVSIHYFTSDSLKDSNGVFLR